jgi:hypothetical protein
VIEFSAVKHHPSLSEMEVVLVAAKHCCNNKSIVLLVSACTFIFINLFVLFCYIFFFNTIYINISLFYKCGISVSYSCVKSVTYLILVLCNFPFF